MPAKSSTPAAAATSRPAATRANGAASARANGTANGHKQEPKVLFQKYFKTISRRTYAAKLKESHDGNQFLVLTEEKPDPETGEIRKSKVSIHSEDFSHYFRMLHETAQFIKTHPVPEAIKMKRMRYWAKKEAEEVAAAREAAAAAAAKPVRPQKVPATVASRPAKASRRPAARSRGR